MRTLAGILLALGFTTAIHAQTHELSIFYSRFDTYGTSDGYGAAFSEQWTPRFSTKLAIGSEKPTVCLGGSFLQTPCTVVTLKTHPVDLSGRFHFVNETRWKPSIGLGVRYVSAPRLSSQAQALRRQGYPDHIDPEVVGGVEFVIAPSFGVSIEAMTLLADSDAYDPTFKASAAFHWRF